LRRSAALLAVIASQAGSPARRTALDEDNANAWKKIRWPTAWFIPFEKRFSPGVEALDAGLLLPGLAGASFVSTKPKY
jgi:hypothetical protein